MIGRDFNSTGGLPLRGGGGGGLVGWGFVVLCCLCCLGGVLRVGPWRV